MSYYSSPRKYENATGRRFTEKCPCIHVTGSVRGMVKLGFWSKESDKVRHGNWIYKQPWNCNFEGVALVTPFIEGRKAQCKILI